MAVIYKIGQAGKTYICAPSGYETVIKLLFSDVAQHPKNFTKFSVTDNLVAVNTDFFASLSYIKWFLQFVPETDIWCVLDNIPSALDTQKQSKFWYVKKVETDDKYFLISESYGKTISMEVFCKQKLHCHRLYYGYYDKDSKEFILGSK